MFVYVCVCERARVCVCACECMRVCVCVSVPCVHIYAVVTIVMILCSPQSIPKNTMSSCIACGTLITSNKVCLNNYQYNFSVCILSISIMMISGVHYKGRVVRWTSEGDSNDKL